MRTSHSQAGFSLLELMVAVAVMGVVTAQLFVVMGNQKKVYSSNERAVDAQETARMTLDLISFDTRMGGYMVPTWLAVSSVDGGAKDPDRFCVSSMFADPGVTGTGNPMEALTTRWEGAKIAAGGLSANSVQVASLNLNPNQDAVDDFATGGGIIIASKDQTYCARIASITPGAPATITFATSDATTYITNITDYTQAVPANVYEVNANNELLRNNMVLAQGIEDLEAEFWVDGSANNLDDGDTEFPVNTLNNPDPPGGGLMARNDRIRRVRISVLAVSQFEDQANSATGNLSYARPKVANRDAGDVPDRFRRRAFSVSIMPRNVIGVQDPVY